MKKNESIFIAHRIRFFRKYRHLSIDKLAVEIDVEKQSISKWENGVNYPTIPNIYKLSDVLDIPVEAFFNDRITIEIFQNTEKIICHPLK